MRHIVLDEERPLVSIIVPVYNSERYVGATLNSLVSQTFKDFEIIIVNDASTDNSKGVIDSFSFDRRIRYFDNDSNLGTGRTLNHGHEFAKGKYVTWCSSDNIYFPNFIEVFVKAFDSISKQCHPVEYLYADFTYIDAQGRRLANSDVIHKPIPKTDLVNGYDFGIAFMYTKSLWDKTGPYWDRICEDYHWTVRAMQHTDPALIQGILAAFRVHGNQITGSRAEEERAAADECKRLARELLLTEAHHA